MKVVFIGSIREKDFYAKSIEVIKNVCNNNKITLICDHVTTYSQEKIDLQNELENTAFHLKLLKNISSTDVVISESSKQSLSVGFLLSHAVSIGKPVVIFFKKGKPKPNLIPTLEKLNKVFFCEYSSDSELKELVEYYLLEMNLANEIRFNMVLSSKLNTFLITESKKRNTSKSDFVRRLILDSMENVIN